MSGIFFLMHCKAIQLSGIYTALILMTKILEVCTMQLYYLEKTGLGSSISSILNYLVRDQGKKDLIGTSLLAISRLLPYLF